MTDLPAIKAALRAEATARRDGLEIDDRLEWDQAIGEHMLAFGPLGESAGPIAAYWPMRSEADPRPILVALKDRALPLALPAMVRRTDGSGNDIQFRSWTPWEPIVPGGFGTLVPAEDAAIVTPAVLIVPLLAFDAAGHRLGYGKGYYDRAIRQLRSLGPLLAIGIAYAAQQVDEVPVEPHDQRLDAIVTERGLATG